MSNGSGNSFDNLLYFTEGISVNPSSHGNNYCDNPRPIQRSVTLPSQSSRANLDSTIDMLAKQLEMNEPKTPNEFYSSRQKRYSFRHFFRARTLSTRLQNGYTMNPRRKICSAEAIGDANALARSKSLESSLCAGGKPDDSGLDSSKKFDESDECDDENTKTRSLPNQYLIRQTALMSADVCSPYPDMGDVRIPKGLPPIPRSKTPIYNRVYEHGDYCNVTVDDKKDGDVGSSPVITRPARQRRSTGPRSCVLHGHCNAVNIKCQPMDLVILFSSNCQVSTEWATYFKRLFTASSQIKVLCCPKVQITIQSLESLSELVANDSFHHRKRLNFLEEMIAHARVQVLILGEEFLDWVSKNQSLRLLNLLVDPSKILGLYLGINESRVLEKHQESLGNFKSWFRTMQISSLATGSVSKALSSPEQDPTNRTDEVQPENETRPKSEDETDSHPKPETDPKLNEYINYQVVLDNSDHSQSKENEVFQRNRSETFLMQLHNSTLQILGKTIQKTTFQDKKSFQVWPESLFMTGLTSRVLLLLSHQLQAGDSTIEVFFTPDSDNSKKVIGHCKIINKSSIEVTVPSQISDKTYKVTLKVNGEPWTSENNLVQFKKPTEDLRYLDGLLADMATRCLPTTLFSETNPTGRQSEYDSEYPSLIHWAARHGLAKMAKALLSFPSSQEVSRKMNTHLLNASQMAQRWGHLEVAHLLGPFSSHNYEYPILQSRPSSDPVAGVKPPKARSFRSVSEEVSNEVLRSNPNQRSTADNNHRYSDPCCSSSNTPAGGVFFTGPVLPERINETYDIPRQISESPSYDVPPRPVPVSRGPDGSIVFKPLPKVNSYVPMHPRTNSLINQSPKPVDPTGGRPQSRQELLKEFCIQSASSEMMIIRDKDVVEPPAVQDCKNVPPISAFNPVVLVNYGSSPFDKKDNSTIKPIVEAKDDDPYTPHLPEKATKKEIHESIESLKEIDNGRMTPSFGMSLWKKSLMSVPETLKRKKKNSVSSSKSGVATPEKKHLKECEPNDIQTVTGCRKRSGSEIIKPSESVQVQQKTLYDVPKPLVSPKFGFRRVCILGKRESNESNCDSKATNVNEGAYENVNILR